MDPTGNSLETFKNEFYISTLQISEDWLMDASEENEIWAIAVTAYTI